MGCELIPDGYTQSDECFGLNVVFRPMPFGDFDDYMNATAIAPNEQRRAIINKHMCDRIVSWEATVKGKPAEITPENFDTLPAAVGQKLRYLITGQVAADDKSTPGDDEKNSEAA